MTKGQEIILLIEEWEKYTLEASTNSLIDFAHWILKNKTDTNCFDQDRTIAFLLHRFQRHSKNAIKLLFTDLPLFGYDDFLILNSVYRNPNIAKKNLYQNTLLEMNTGTQIVNRLKREKLLEDKPNEQDRRVSLLNITLKGKKVYDMAFARLGKEVNNKFSILSQAEKRQLLILIKKVELHQSNLAKENKKEE